jgi:MoaA/NifB/PqqE/SkfB family radical SAM enzyme
MSLRSFFKQLRSPRRRHFGAWQVELTTRCPLRCLMCIRQGLEGWRGEDMAIDQFRRIAPYFRDVGSVVLEGWGEPLLYPHLLEAIRLVKDQGTRAGFVTSGKGLTRDYSAELVRAGLDFMAFSLAGASPETHNAIRVHSDLAEILPAVENLLAIKRDGGLTTPEVHIVFLMLRDNLDEVPLLLKTASLIGITDVVLIHLIHVTNEWQDRQRVFHCEAQDEEAILRESQALASDLKIRLRVAPVAPQDVAVCAENPLDNVYVSVSGEVSPCVYLYPPASSPFLRIFCGSRHMLDKVSFGNVFEQSFEHIWNDVGYMEFRKSFRRRRQAFVEHFGPMPLTLLSEIRPGRKPGDTTLPPPPVPCRTCHKMLGV